MVIYLITCDEQGLTNQISFGFDRLEVGLEMVNVLVSEGENLLEVRLVDKKHSMLLPTEAFDGSSCLKPIKKLQKEWRQLLKKPLQPALKLVAPNQEHVELTQKRLSSWEAKITSYTNLIVFLEAALEKTPDGALQSHYQFLMKATQNRLEVARLACQSIADHLARLTES